LKSPLLSLISFYHTRAPAATVLMPRPAVPPQKKRRPSAPLSLIDVFDWLFERLFVDV